MSCAHSLGVLKNARVSRRAVMIESCHDGSKAGVLPMSGT